MPPPNLFGDRFPPFKARPKNLLSQLGWEIVGPEVLMGSGGLSWRGLHCDELGHFVNVENPSPCEDYWDGRYWTKTVVAGC